MATTNTSVTVLSTTTVLKTLGQHNNIIITNDSVNDVYLAINEDAVMNSGIRLNAEGGKMHFDNESKVHEAINAIATTTSTVLLTYR